MTARKTKPEQATVIHTYAELAQFVEAFANGHLNLLVLIGRAGIAKSQTVRQTIDDRACWIEGNATAFGIYTALWHHRDELVVIDDVDALYTNRSAVRLLKCLCQTDPVKNVAWHTAAVGNGHDDVPRQFSTSSRVCIIANDWKTLDANTAAVQDRGHLVIFEPTALEVHRQVAQWFWDQDVFDWFADHLHLISQPSMRHYVRAAELKQAGIDWVKPILSDAIPAKALLVAKLKADPSYTEERDRVKVFRELGAGGQTTYYKYAKKLQPTTSKPARISLEAATAKLHASVGKAA